MRTETAVCLGGGGTHTVHKEKAVRKGIRDTKTALKTERG